jgi:hypothetical protein
MALLIMTASAQAQMGGRHRQESQRKTETKPKVDEKAYDSALKALPDQSANYDPWRNMREPNQTAKPRSPK